MLHEFFSDYLALQLSVSEHTIKAYRDTWRLFLRFLQSRRKRCPSEMLVSDLRPTDVLDFLDYVENDRGNSSRSRNARLAAIRSAVRHALALDPTLPVSVQGILAVPLKKTKRRILDFLTRFEVDSILDAPDMSTWSGLRDRLLLAVLYNTGARVSEIAGIQVSDVLLDARQLILHGKGRKERAVPLWKTTVSHIRAWLKDTGFIDTHPLFPNVKGAHMTRSGIEKRLADAVRRAKENCPSLSNRSIGPHTFRHTTAMHLLDAGVDITVIALWLGHESIETTNVYITSSLEMKEKHSVHSRHPN